MAYLGSFDANTVEPSDFSALPAGDYTAIISNSEWKDSKSGPQYLALTYQILEGPAKGRYVWHNLNLNSVNATARDISQRDLSAICRATGRMAISDSDELHDIPHVIRVAYIPPKGEWPEKNQIKKWSIIGEAQAPQPAPRPQPAPQRAGATPPPATPPWRPKADPAPEAVVDFDSDMPF